MTVTCITENNFGSLSAQDLSASKILIVDDEPSIRIILADIIQEAGYSIDELDNGTNALEHINSSPPDLILLDAMMPGIDGFQVCREIRKDSTFQEIPIIFITALDTPENLVEAFEAGANDYLTKPFNDNEVRVRIRNHLRLKKAIDKLKRYSCNLERLVEEESRGLIKTERQAAFGQLIQGIIHNLKGPLTAISAGIQTIKFSLRAPPFEKDDDQATSFCQSMSQSLEMVESGSKRLTSMINSMMSRSRAEVSGNFEDTDFNKIIKDEIDFLDADLRFKHKFRKDIKLADKPLKVKAVPSELAQVVNNLVRNAMDALHDHPDPYISFETNCNEGNVFLVISDNGPGIAPENINNIFDPLFTTKPKADNDAAEDGSPTGTGLGLYTCMRIIRSHQGNISVHSGSGKGTTFRVNLPSYSPESIMPDIKSS